MIKEQTIQALITCLCFSSLMVLFVEYFEYYRKTDEVCGIPVIWWSEIFIIIYLFQGILQINVIWMARTQFFELVPLYQILVPVTIMFAISGWTIYGIVLFNSKKNDCDKNPITEPWD